MPSWFPRYNSTGQIVHEDAGKWQAQWILDSTPIWHNGANLVIGGQVTAFRAGNEVAAGAGKWAVCIAEKDNIRIETSWGETIPNAGVPAISPSGAFAYIDDRQSAVKNLIVGGHKLATGAIWEVRASNQAIVWTDGAHSMGWSAATGVISLNPGVEHFRPIPIDTPEGPWVLNHTGTGIILRPFGQLLGHRYDNGGQCYYPDGVCIGDVICVAFTNERGELEERKYPLSAARTPLAAPPIDTPPTHKDPDPPHKDPVKEPTPMSFPIPARAKAIVQALYERNVGLAEGDDDARRALVLKIAQQLAFELGPQWGTKRAGEGRPPSKDAIAHFDGVTLFGADVFNGSTRKPAVPNEMEEMPGQVFIKVEPFNFLNTDLGKSPEEPGPTTPTSATPFAASAAALEARFAALTAKVESQAKEIAELKARPSGGSTPTFDGLRFSIRTENGHYLSAAAGGGQFPFNRPELDTPVDGYVPGGWETFTLVTR